MARGRTYRDALHGKPPGADDLIRTWNTDLVNRLLGFVWAAYDDLHTTAWTKVDWTLSYDVLERELTQEFELAIRRAMRVLDGYLSIEVQHGPFEYESRSAPPAQPPQYDIAFLWHADRRIMWPLEAKVLKNDKNTQDNLKDYVDTLQKRYLTCIYAPYSNGGAMLGYLKQGNPETVMGHIAGRLGTTLDPHPDFPSRCHKTSDHTRIVPPGKDYPAAFRCHHLILPLS